MTLLVYPVVEFLDEPTCGVDPVSRKHLFQMIKRLSSSAVLMTTHRMEEAERLCDLIAIMVNGSIVCYGSPTYLMETYGGGYEVICAVDMGKSNENEVRRQLWNKLPQKFKLMAQNFAPLSDEKVMYMDFKFAPEVHISKIFEVMTEMVEAETIEYFKATRTSLGQVFSAFARMQQSRVVDEDIMNNTDIVSDVSKRELQEAVNQSMYSLSNKSGLSLFGGVSASGGSNITPSYLNKKKAGSPGLTNRASYATQGD